MLTFQFLLVSCGWVPFLFWSVLCALMLHTSLLCRGKVLIPIVWSDSFLTWSFCLWSLNLTYLLPLSSVHRQKDSTQIFSCFSLHSCQFLNFDLMCDKVMQTDILLWTDFTFAIFNQRAICNIWAYVSWKITVVVCTRIIKECAYLVHSSNVQRAQLD